MRLVTSRVSRGARANSLVYSGAPARKCSALSTMSNSSRERSASASVSNGSAPRTGSSASASAIAPSMWLGSRRGASSTKQVPLVKESAALTAASSASLVLPDPPAPVNTSNRTRSSSKSRRNSVSSRSRPSSRFGGAGSTASGCSAAAGAGARVRSCWRIRRCSSRSSPPGSSPSSSIRRSRTE